MHSSPVADPRNSQTECVRPAIMIQSALCGLRGRISLLNVALAEFSFGYWGGRSAIRSHAGMAWCASVMIRPSRSTTTRPSGRCLLSLSVITSICSQGQSRR
jgi:hypothetical protein